MKNKKRLFVIIATIAVLIAIGAAMMVIGRGHTVYFDNKKLETETTTYEPYYKVEVYADDEQIAKLSAKDRGISEVMGQKYSVRFAITKEKGGPVTEAKVTLALPGDLDGIIVNIPALMAGAPKDVYMSEFVSLAIVTDAEDEEIIIDDTGMGDF